MAGRQEKKERIKEPGSKELWDVIREGKPDAILGAALDKDLTEGMAIFMAKSRHTPAEALGQLSTDVRFKDSYRLKVSIARNPKTPMRVALSLLKFLKIFDLADLTRDQRVPVGLRQKVEQSLSERIPALPSGVKSALSRRVSGNLLVAIIQRGDGNAISASLESPYLTEGALYKEINRQGVRPLFIKLLAEHPKWSLRYDIRLALLRNFYTPTGRAVEFIGGMRTGDLRGLYADPSLPASVRPFIHRELLERGADVQVPEDEEYSIGEEELSEMEEEEFE